MHLKESAKELPQVLPLKAFNLSFKGLTRKIVLESDRKFTFIVTCNAEFIGLANQKEERLKKIIGENFATLDGEVTYWLAHIKNRNKKFEKIAGSDLSIELCNKAHRLNKKIFFLGGDSESNTLAIQKIKDDFGPIVGGYSPDFEAYPFSDPSNKKILQRLKEFQPDYLLVAFGCPKQEYWIDDNKEMLQEIGVEIVAGVGGSLNFIAQTEKRAPIIIQKLGLESVWRLILNPVRWRRWLKNFLILRYI